jgi:hypothetical protein
VTGGPTMLLAVPSLPLRRMRERTDIFVGQKAGQAAACASQGLPQVASVEITARQPATTSTQ